MHEVHLIHDFNNIYFSVKFKHLSERCETIQANFLLSKKNNFHTIVNL